MKRAYTKCMVFLKHISKNNVSSYAAGAAYYFFLALIPILIILMAIIPYTPLTEEDIVSWITELFPDTFDSLLTGIIREVYKRSITVISVSAIAVFWSASKGIFSLVRGLNSVYRIEETRNMIWMRIKSGFYTIFLMVMIVLLLIINIFGDRLVNIVLSDIPMVINIWSIIKYFRYLIFILLLTILFVVIFLALPNRKAPLLSQVPGALAASLSWAACTRAFNIYIDRFSKWSMYGSLTTIIIMMFWFDVLMYLLLCGAQLNYFLEPNFTKSKEQSEILKQIAAMKSTKKLNDKLKLNEEKTEHENQ